MTIQRMNEKKCNLDSFTDLSKTTDWKFKEFHDSIVNDKHLVDEKFEKLEAKFHKINTFIETKAPKEVIFELIEKINYLAHKDEIKDIENKVFPMMKDVITKITSINNKVEESSRSMIRFDELIMDKANKVDVSNLYKITQDRLIAEDF